MPLTTAERTGLENLKVKIDTATTRIESEVTVLETNIGNLTSSKQAKQADLNQLANAKEAVQTLLDIDASGNL